MNLSDALRHDFFHSLSDFCDGITSQIPPRVFRLWKTMNGFHDDDYNDWDHHYRTMLINKVLPFASNSISLSLIISLSVSLIISLSLFLIISLSFFLIVSLLFQCDRSAADRPCGGGVRGVSERARGESDGREEREERQRD